MGSTKGADNRSRCSLGGGDGEEIKGRKREREPERERWRRGEEKREGGREAITGSVFSHRFTQAIALPILCRRPLSMELLSSVAPPLKILLRFHKKKKSNCGAEVMNADRLPRLLHSRDTEHLCHTPLSLLPSSANCAARGRAGLNHPPLPLMPDGRFLPPLLRCDFPPISIRLSHPPLVSSRLPLLCIFSFFFLGTRSERSWGGSRMWRKYFFRDVVHLVWIVLPAGVLNNSKLLSNNTKLSQKQ